MGTTLDLGFSKKELSAMIDRLVDAANGASKRPSTNNPSRPAPADPLPQTESGTPKR